MRTGPGQEQLTGQLVAHRRKARLAEPGLHRIEAAAGQVQAGAQELCAGLPADSVAISSSAWRVWPAGRCERAAAASTRRRKLGVSSRSGALRRTRELRLL